MILVDTSIWIDHLRSSNDGLTRLLERGFVLGHTWVVGEIALGHLRRRREVLDLLLKLPRAVLASDHEVLAVIERNALQGTGVGYVDAQLLASTRLTPGAVLWTQETRLASIARRLRIAHSE